MKNTRYLVVVALAAIIGGWGFSLCRGNRSGSREETRGSKSPGTATTSTAYAAAEESGKADEPEPDPMEYWDSLTGDDKYQVYMTFDVPSDECGEGMGSMDIAYLMRTVDGIPKDTTAVLGPWHDLIGKDGKVRFVVGVDTFDMSIRRRFPKVMDLRFRDAIPGVVRHRLSREFALSEHSFDVGFQINVGLPNDTAPLWMLDLISRLIRDDVDDFFDVDNSDVRTFDMSKGSVRDMMEHYHRRFHDLYVKEHGGADSDGKELGPAYWYDFYAYPVWQNSDSTLTTWKFYNNVYMGGAHGNDAEWFATFENATGRQLGISDFFTARQFEETMETLKRQINGYHKLLYDSDEGYEADMDMSREYIKSSKAAQMMIDTHGGKIYPRPALTSQGIVFTYQKYEKGYGADGVLHFTQSYNRDYRLKKRPSK